MKNKIIFYGIALFIVMTSLVYVYCQSLSKDTPVVPKTKTNGHLSYDNVNQFVLEQEKEVALFFFSSTDTDSQHVIENMLGTIQYNLRLEKIPNLYFVDLATLPDNVGDKYTKNSWGFYHYPTFTVMKINKDQIEIKDILEWDATNPYTIDDVHKWLQDHKLID